MMMTVDIAANIKCKIISFSEYLDDFNEKKKATSKKSPPKQQFSRMFNYGSIPFTDLKGTYVHYDMIFVFCIILYMLYS